MKLKKNANLTTYDHQHTLLFLVVNCTITIYHFDMMITFGARRNMCQCTPGIKKPFCGKDGCHWPNMPPRTIAADSVVEAVRQDLLNRSNVGITKYGTTLDNNRGDLRYWLNHAYEECLDQANYLKRAIMELDKNK